MRGWIQLPAAIALRNRVCTIAVVNTRAHITSFRNRVPVGSVHSLRGHLSAYNAITDPSDTMHGGGGVELKSQLA